MRLGGNDMCFACGKKNPIGLKLEFQSAGEDYASELTIEENHQGFAGIVHGGIIATALDEVMARMLLDRGYNAITARLEMRFKRPITVGETLRLRAYFVKERGRLIDTEAKAFNESGIVVADAKATSMCV